MNSKQTPLGLSLAASAVSVSTAFYVNSKITAITEKQEQHETAQKNLIDKIDTLRAIPNQIEQLVAPIHEVKRNHTNQQRTMKSMQKELKVMQQKLKQYEQWFNQMQEALNKNAINVHLKKKKTKKKYISSDSESGSGDESDSESEEEPIKPKRRHKHKKKKRAHYSDEEFDSELEVD